MGDVINDENDATESDQIRRYDAAVPDDGLTFGDPMIVEAIDRHITSTIGPVSGVFHEILSAYVHIDVHHIAPSAERPFHVLVTSGMSEKPMAAPEGAEEFRYSELIVCLPSDWPVSDEAFAEERHYWPVQWLKELARFPHVYGTWLSFGHNPERRSAGTVRD